MYVGIKDTLIKRILDHQAKVSTCSCYNVMYVDTGVYILINRILKN